MRGQRLALVVAIILVVAVTLALRAHSLARIAEQSTGGHFQDRLREASARPSLAHVGEPRDGLAAVARDEASAAVQVLTESPPATTTTTTTPPWKRESAAAAAASQWRPGGGGVVLASSVPSSSATTSATFDRFHGFYPCQIGTPCPSYSAAFLASRAQLLSNPVTATRMERANTNMESASYHAMGTRGKYDVWRTVDALDFSVEHLSMYERMIHASKIPPRPRGEKQGGPSSPIAEALYETFVERLRKYESHLKRRCGGDEDQGHHRQSVLLPASSRRTVAIMPYYAAGGAGSGHTRFESKELYLNITIRSMRCHFGAVAVACLHPGDKAYLESGRGRPRLDHIVAVDPATLPVNKPSFLGIATVRAVQQLWGDDKAHWARNYDYLYYTEADQVLHLRDKHRAKLYRCLSPPKSKSKSSPRAEDSLGGGDFDGKLGILTPHRLNALPRAQDFADLVLAFGLPEDGGASPPELARRIRAERFGQFIGQHASYDPAVDDPWYRIVFGTPGGSRKNFIRRELDGYGSKNLTRVRDDDNFRDGSCCYLKAGESSYPYRDRGKAGGVRLDDTVAGQFDEPADRASPVEFLALGDHGLGILAGLCCHICARSGKLGRHCDNFCSPATAGHENCAVGRFADHPAADGRVDSSPVAGPGTGDPAQSRARRRVVEKGRTMRMRTRRASFAVASAQPR